MNRPAKADLFALRFKNRIMSATPKILIVDDELDVELLFRQQFRREIRNKELELVFAFSGEEALDHLASQHPPEVVYIFSDINMPGMTGLEMLEIIRKKYPEMSVSMISAYADTEYKDKAIESGAEGFFTKPIDFKVLKRKVSEIIAGE